VEASVPEAVSELQGAALDEARAEFRAAWQAKQERAARVRQLAGKVARVETWAVRIAKLLILVTACILVGSLIAGAFQLDLVRAPVYGMLACRGVDAFAGWVRTRLNRYADQMEADEVRYP
jgi:hypothetical protein